MCFGGVFDIAGMQRRLDELEQVTADPDFWSDEKRRMGILKEQAYLDRKSKSFLV